MADSQAQEHLDAREPQESDSLAEIYRAVDEFGAFFEGTNIVDPEDIETHVVPRTEEFIRVVYQLNEKVKIFSQKKSEVLYQFLRQDISNPYSDFFRIKGLVMHDVVKAFNVITGYIDLCTWACVDGKIIPEEYGYLSQYIPSILKIIDEAKAMLEMLAKYRTQRSVLSSDVLRAIGIEKDSETDSRYRNITEKEDPLAVFNQNDWDTQYPEAAFTLSTLILNARSAHASEITIDFQELEEGLELVVRDNANGNEFPETYTEDLKRYFEEGMKTPIDELTESSGGGKLSAFLAGQRYALTHPLTAPGYYDEYFSWEPYQEVRKGNQTIIHNKGLRIFFPRQVIDYSLNDMGLNYYGERIANLIAMTHENEFKNSREQDVRDFIANIRESLGEDRQNIFSLIRTSNREQPINSLIDTIESAVRSILEQVQLDSNLNWDLAIRLLHILRLTINIYFENNLNDYPKLKTLVDPFISTPMELNRAA